ncbi:hypothetical protein GQ457_08G011840 [Hibiscus cannabinus]
MSRRNSPKVELKLNLSPTRLNPRVVSPSRATTTSPTSSPSSCVSSHDMNMTDPVGYLSSPEVKSSAMALVGCPRCLMYVMLSGDDPKCPKCKSTVLLDFLHDTATTTNVKTRRS